MRHILNEKDLTAMDLIKDKIQDKDIRTHTQLKAELKDLGYKVDIKRDTSGNVKSYSISQDNPNTNGKGQLFNWNSEKGMDRAVMQQFDKAIDKNRNKAIERANEKNKKPIQGNEKRQQILALRKGNKALNEGKGFGI